MRKRLFYVLICLLVSSASAFAQEQVKYGKISYKGLLRSMPEFKIAQEKINELRQQFESEAQYNETSFKRQFSEFLQGQKEFPQSILLKRQRDLQEAMTKGIAFRQTADSLLREAQKEMEQPLRARLDSAIMLVGIERGYECIVNTDVPSHLFIQPALTEDATLYVLDKIVAIKPQE